jgi:hypothetical protein
MEMLSDRIVLAIWRDREERKGQERKRLTQRAQRRSREHGEFFEMKEIPSAALHFGSGFVTFFQRQAEIEIADQTMEIIGVNA